MSLSSLPSRHQPPEPAEHGGPLVPPGAPDELSLLRLGSLLLRYRYLVIRLALLGALIAIVPPLVLPRSYTVSSALTPQSRRQNGTLTGLAGQLGLALPLNLDGGQSPAFYADRLTSRQLLGQVVDTRYTIGTDTGTVTVSLVEFFAPRGKTPELRRDAAVRELSEAVDASVDNKTGIVSLAVTLEHPNLARQVNQRMLDLLNEFNLQNRQSQAAAERRFTETRVAQVRRDLREAEDRLQAFLQRNREYRFSPELTFQHDRLQREIDLQQEVFTTLAQAYEQARIEEVRDTPVITIVETPADPVRPDSRRLVLKGLLGILLGALAGVALTVARGYAANAPGTDGAAASEFNRLRREAMGEIARPWRALARTLVPGRG
jgi:uncharacterized protein involved in exopolysaccharide biosynthesis